MKTLRDAMAIKKEYGSAILSHRGIVGVGVDKDDQGGFVILYINKDPMAGRDLPPSVNGVRLLRQPQENQKPLTVVTDPKNEVKEFFKNQPATTVKIKDLF